MRFLAKTYAGLEEILSQELMAIGADNIKIIRRAVTFEGDNELMYQANHKLRTALSILIPIKRFTARDSQTLYRQVKAFAWEDYLDPSMTFAIEKTVYSKFFKHSQYAALKVKDAIADRFMGKRRSRPSVDTHRPDVLINLHIAEDRCTLSLNSSGAPLFKRGYRRHPGEAPLSEVLAAGLIKLSGWGPSVDLVDPMCGSGTIVIEAAMLAAGLPTGMFREHYGFERWKNFNEDMWHGISEKSHPKSLSASIRGFDKSGMSIARAITNAGLLPGPVRPQLKRLDFFKLKPENERGFLLFNPPYDIRMKESDIADLYRRIGDHLKKNWPGWDAWIISANTDAMKNIGLKHTKHLQLYNGPHLCHFNRFTMYAGKDAPAQ